MIPSEKKLDDLIQEKINNSLNMALIGRGKVSVNDLNDLTQAGIYWIGADVPKNSCNDADWSQLIVINNSFLQQIIINPVDSFISIRQKSGSPAAWSSWRRFDGKPES